MSMFLKCRPFNLNHREEQCRVVKKNLVLVSQCISVSTSCYPKGGQGRSQTPDLGALSDQEYKSPLRIAEDTLRKLIGRASFTSIRYRPSSVTALDGGGVGLQLGSPGVLELFSGSSRFSNIPYVI